MNVLTNLLTMTWLRISISKLISQSVCLYESHTWCLTVIDYIGFVSLDNDKYVFSFTRIACLPTLEES